MAENSARVVTGDYDRAHQASNRMSHLAYYQYQTTARGIQSVDDVKRNASEKAYIYDRVVLPWLPGDKQARIAELACGHGSFLWWLKERGYSDIHGVDSSPEQLHFAKQVATVHQADVIDWLALQKDGSYGTLVAIDFIEHISKDAFMEFMRGTHRVLGVGGRLILRYPNGDSPLVGHNLFADITHVWTYTPGCLQTLANMHGFGTVHFADEGYKTVRDHRWLKIPLGRLSTAILRLLFRAATRENIEYWSPHLWVRLNK
jgi:2-polyprenyl-3-methyl-5-hydroxy-6-metoxy-1,4-benzoquinol methylase